MSNDEPKLTVFVSSMIGPMWDERVAVEEAIRTGIPLARTWVFERAPASSEEITESYLARVRECDVYLLILGEDVSDPVKEEYQTAVECEKPRLCFMQEGVERTEALEEFLPTLQADVKYATFSDEESLRREVLRAVRQELVWGYKRYRLDKAEREQIVTSVAALPTLEELAAYRTAVADRYAKWDDPRYIQEEGEFLPLFASPYDEIEGPGRERTDLLDAIRSAQRIIVLGEPGMGKTTALERLMLEYARQGDGPLPVVVPLLYYTGDLMGSIRTELNRHAAFHLPDEAHTRAFLQGVPCVLMFDGLNEVSGRLRERIAGEIRQVMSDYPRQRYAVTSRSQDELWQSLRGEDEDLPAVVIREISDEQVRDYLCGHLGAEARQALYDRLDERMRGLAHNPLLLWMIKEARTDKAGALPDNRGRLFDHFVTQMLKREVRLKEWAVSVPAEVKRECLAELAYEMFTSERESRLFVASPQAEAVLAVYLEGRPGARYEVRQVLEESKRNGLLVGEENVRFMHQSVQEFFAALVLKGKVRIDTPRTGLGRFRKHIRNTVISRLIAAAEAPRVSPPWRPERSPPRSEQLLSRLEWSPQQPAWLPLDERWRFLSCVSFLALVIIVLCVAPSVWYLVGADRLSILRWPAAIMLLVGLLPLFPTLAWRLAAWSQISTWRLAAWFQMSTWRLLA